MDIYEVPKKIEKNTKSIVNESLAIKNEMSFSIEESFYLPSKKPEVEQ